MQYKLLFKCFQNGQLPDSTKNCKLNTHFIFLLQFLYLTVSIHGTLTECQVTRSFDDDKRDVRSKLQWVRSIKRQFLSTFSSLRSCLQEKCGGNPLLFKLKQENGNFSKTFSEAVEVTVKNSVFVHMCCKGGLESYQNYWSITVHCNL